MEKDCKDCKKAIPNGDSGHEWKCTADEYDIEGKTCFEPRSESLDEVISNQDQQPVVSFFVHQADMMQKDADNERLHETMKQITREQRRGYIFIIVFLVIMFTIRMFIWNTTITSMKDSIIEIASMHHQGCSEVYNAEESNTSEIFK